jgi:hypothetical protein
MRYRETVGPDAQEAISRNALREPPKQYRASMPTTRRVDANRLQVRHLCDASPERVFSTLRRDCQPKVFRARELWMLVVR